MFDVKKWIYGEKKNDKIHNIYVKNKYVEICNGKDPGVCWPLGR